MTIFWIALTIIAIPLVGWYLYHFGIGFVASFRYHLKKYRK